MSALIDVDQLRTFIAIVETGSFTKAAEVVHKTQSAVSMQMKRLEERLGKAIFARDGRASKLTEDGDRLLDYARRIIKLNVEALAAFDDAELAGRVRLGCQTITPTATYLKSWRGSRAPIRASSSP
jgi:DNA-binding transcriptional LysR family regulator